MEVSPEWPGGDLDHVSTPLQEAAIPVDPAALVAGPIDGPVMIPCFHLHRLGDAVTVLSTFSTHPGGRLSPTQNRPFQGLSHLRILSG